MEFGHENRVLLVAQCDATSTCTIIEQSHEEVQANESQRKDILWKKVNGVACLLIFLRWSVLFFLFGAAKSPRGGTESTMYRCNRRLQDFLFSLHSLSIFHTSYSRCGAQQYVRACDVYIYIHSYTNKCYAQQQPTEFLSLFLSFLPVSSLSRPWMIFADVTLAIFYRFILYSIFVRYIIICMETAVFFSCLCYNSILLLLLSFKLCLTSLIHVLASSFYTTGVLHVFVPATLEQIPLLTRVSSVFSPPMFFHNL